MRAFGTQGPLSVQRTAGVLNTDLRFLFRIVTATCRASMLRSPREAPARGGRGPARARPLRAGAQDFEQGLSFGFAAGCLADKLPGYLKLSFIMGATPKLGPEFGSEEM